MLIYWYYDLWSVTLWVTEYSENETMKTLSRKVWKAHVNTLDDPANNELLHYHRDQNGCMTSPSIMAAPQVPCLHSYWRACMRLGGAKLRCRCKRVHGQPCVVLLCNMCWCTCTVLDGSILYDETAEQGALESTDWNVWSYDFYSDVPHQPIQPWWLTSSYIKWQHKGKNFDPFFGIL